MGPSRTRLAGSIDSVMAAASVRFMDAWAVVERAYRRGDALEKRRELMLAWSSFVEGRQANVIELQTARAN